MPESIPLLEGIVHGRDILLVFPMGAFPRPAAGEVKPRFGIGLHDARPALYQLFGRGAPVDAVCIAYLPPEGLAAYIQTPNLLCAEADPVTGDVHDRGWFRPKSLFEAHLHRK